MILLKSFINIFYIPELRKKFLFTLGILVVYSFGRHIPVVGVDVNALHQWIENVKGLGGLFAYLDMFSGGALQSSTLFSLGMMPYITASIMMQILGMSVPYLEQLLKEGEYGRRIVNQYTRYLALGISIMHSFFFATMLERNNLVLEPGWSFRLLFILSLTVGSMLVMWLGEQISLFGLGNGSSMIIFAGIVGRFPDDMVRTIHYVREGMTSPVIALLIWLVLVAITACVVFLERGERKIPVHYTRRVVGQRVYGGQSAYIPFRINNANIMPVIFAGTALNIPMFFASMLSKKFTFFRIIYENMLPTSLVYNLVQFLLIFFFTFVYTSMIYDPHELSENMKKNGGFIPGIRPGKKTADFFNYILTRIGVVGALYLGILATLPNIMAIMIDNMPFYLGGTALLIVVGVALETAAQIESYLIEHRYDGFLSSGRITGRRVIR